jgi:hypothetical protein
LDVVIDVISVSDELAKRVVIVRVFKFPACATLLVINPDATATVHNVCELNEVCVAVNVRVAVAVPEFVELALNAVPPQLADGLANALNVKSGSTTSIASPTASVALNENTSRTDVLAMVTGLPNCKLLNVTAGVANGVDLLIGVAWMLATAFNVAAAVLVLKPAVCAVALVVMPVLKMSVHCVNAFKTLDFAVNAITAFAVPEKFVETSNVVEPHPLVEGATKEPNENIGSTTKIESPMASGSFIANWKVIDDGAEVIGLPSTRDVYLNAGGGYITAVDVMIAVAGMFLALASVTAMVRVPIFDSWPAALFVNPDATVIVHFVLRTSCAVCAVNTSFAADVPELLATTLNDVLPQPLMLGVDIVPRNMFGSTTDMESPVSIAALSENVNAIDDAFDVMGLAMTNEDLSTAGETTAVDVTIAVLAMLPAVANVASSVRVFRFSDCSDGVVVTPVAIETVQSVPGASVAVAAVKTNLAVTVSESSAATLNAVLPQPTATGVDKLANTKSGSLRVRVSEASSATLKETVSVIIDGEAETGFAMTRSLRVTALADTALENGTGVAAMFSDAERLKARVRVSRFAICDASLVVTPDGTDTVHFVCAVSSAVEAVK